MVENRKEAFETALVDVSLALVSDVRNSVGLERCYYFILLITTTPRLQLMFDTLNFNQ